MKTVIVLERLLHCALLYVWMAVLVLCFKGYRAGGVEETSSVPECIKSCSVGLLNNDGRGEIIEIL